MTDQYHPHMGLLTRIKRESSYGVPGSSDWMQLNGFGMNVSPSIVKNPVRVPGAFVPVGNTVDDQSGTGSYEGAIDLNGIIIPYSSIFGPPTTTSLGSGAYQHKFIFKGRKPNRAVTWTAHMGYAGRAREATGLIFNSFSMSGGRPDGFTVNGNVFSKVPTPITAFGGTTNEVQRITITGSPTSGSFDLTVLGETITVPYNASASALLALLEATFNIEPGDVAVSGGALPGTPIDVAFGGYYAGENVPQMTVNNAGLSGGSSPAAAVTTTTPGAEDVVNISQKIAGATSGDVWVDDSWAALGTTKSISTLGLGFDIPDRMQRVTPIDSSFAGDGIVDMGEQDFTQNLQLAWNAASDEEYLKLINGEPTFIRTKFTGLEIGGGIHYSLMVDSCVDWSGVDNVTETQGVATMPYNGSLIIDPTTQNFLEVTVVNTLANLTPSN